MVSLKKSVELPVVIIFKVGSDSRYRMNRLTERLYSCYGVACIVFWSSRRLNVVDLECW